MAEKTGVVTDTIAGAATGSGTASRAERKLAKLIPPHHAARHPGKWRLTMSVVLSALTMLLGLLILLYPQTTMWLTQYNLSKINNNYNHAVDNAEPEARRQLRLAREYNKWLQEGGESAGAVYEANTNIPVSSANEEESAEKDMDPAHNYWNQLKANNDGLMARLMIKKIDLDLPVYHGTSDETLLKGLGHLRGTALPVGGVGNRAVITGHRGLASAEMFTRLNEIDKGDTFTIAVFGEVLTYQVIEKIVVEPTERKAIQPVPGKDLVTLVTCTPLGINTHRILVTGERIIPTPAKDKEAANKPSEVPRFPWWALEFALGLLLIGLYVWWAGLPPVPRPKKDDPDKKNAKKLKKRGLLGAGALASAGEGTSAVGVRGTADGAAIDEGGAGDVGESAVVGESDEGSTPASSEHADSEGTGTGTATSHDSATSE